MTRPTDQAQAKRVLGYREEQILPLLVEHSQSELGFTSYGVIGRQLSMQRHHVCDTVRRLERRGYVTRHRVGRFVRVEVGYAGIMAVANGR